MSHQTHTLPNGLRIIQASSPTGVAYCGYAVDAGTRDEQDDEQGMAHFVEHLIFKGTRKRKAWHILNRMERVGGDLNAYTNKEETVVYSTFLKEHFARAAELLTDIVFGSTFPQAEIEKEVEVIIDEIQSYEDSPSELIFDDFEELIFPIIRWDATFWDAPTCCAISTVKTPCVSWNASTSPRTWCFCTGRP